MRSGASALGLGLLGLVFLARPAVAKDPDPAARGLDVFVHAPTSVFGGGHALVALEAYGFPAVTTARPLAGAEITAAWDPESLGETKAAPPAVTLTTDARGVAQLDLAVPEGDDRALVLLLALRHGEHVRTQTVGIHRTPAFLVDLRLPDTHVVPGSRVPAWVSVVDLRSTTPVAKAGVDVVLLEGEVELAHGRLTTDATGLGRASFIVPENVTGTPRLSVRARLVGGVGERSVDVGLREESPAMPRMTVAFRERELRPAETGHAEVTLFDASEEPLAGWPVTWWAGPRGVTPPKTDDEWKKSGKVARTDGVGKVVIDTPAPKVVTSAGSEITVHVRSELEGQKIDQTASIPVGQAVAKAMLVPEAHALVPGVAQKLYLHVDDGDHGVGGAFALAGDGLAAQVTTDAHGDAEVAWTIPKDVGAARNKGPCAGDVAAAVTIRATSPIAALARHPEPFEVCVPVARERTELLRVSPVVARAGSKVRVTALDAKKTAAGPASLVVKSADGSGTARWTGSGDEIDLAGIAPGLHQVTLATPRADGATKVATELLVVPTVLPRMTAKVVGGRSAPLGEIEVEATLDDGHGKPVLGAVSALVIDKEGGGNVEGLRAMDLRRSLCTRAHLDDLDRCDAFLEGDAEVARRAALSTGEVAALAPLGDPAAGATASMRDTFAAVLKSLEGAVYQAKTPEDLRDVRRREGGGWRFNPELMTLVTAAMDKPPVTPGGEPFGLRDLVAIDPQVTFDVVGRRVTRLKLFKLLVALRTFRNQNEGSPDEPFLRDPPALLRRLVRDSTIEAEQLLDPWGGTIQFVHATGVQTPFLNFVTGWSLQSPGPDGQIGTGDDVRDPFERAVRAGTPYAKALGEEEIVDARLDMRVGDPTISNWEAMFARLTGTELGGGQGFGNGSGRLGGMHSSSGGSGYGVGIRTGHGITFDTARWTEPVRTDANGKVRLKVRLGDHETTWRVALLARTDAADSAVTTLDVPAFLSVSARVDLGSKLTRGDELGARVILRNRTNAARPVTVDLVADGALALAKDQGRTITMTLPPQSARSVFARILASAEGTGRLTASLRAGNDADTTTQVIAVEPAGEPSIVMATWAAPGGKSKHRFQVDLAPGFVPRGPSTQLVVANGLADPLLAAMESLTPDASTPPTVLADAVDVGLRAEAIAGADPGLVARAKKLATDARAYLEVQIGKKTANASQRLAQLRVALHPDRKGSTFSSCPDGVIEDDTMVLDYLEAEPAPERNGPLPCYTKVVAKLDPKTALDRARAVQALLDRPHRMPLAASIAKELAQATRADGLAPRVDGTRAEQAIILSALARSATSWSTKPEAARVLVNRVLGLRDARGGYGSAEATRDVVRALAALETKAPSAAHVVVKEGKKEHVLDVAPNVTTTLTLPPGAHDLDVRTEGGPVLVRFVRPALRGFGAPPDLAVAPLTVATEWPTEATVGSTAVLHVTYKRGIGRPLTVSTRIPLPPGVDLAEKVDDVHVRQGALHIEATPDGTQTLSIPIRFRLPGRFVIAPSETRGRSDEEPRITTPAGTLNVR